MTIITESLISECQSQKTISINDVIYASLNKALLETLKYNLSYDLNNKDVVRIVKHNLILYICNLKKDTKVQDPIFYIDTKDLSICKKELKIVIEIVSILELFKRIKSKTFYKKLLRYLIKEELIFLLNVYFKQVTNKLILYT